MNDKMREALELIRKEDDEWGSLGVKAREMVDEALATPPTEQVGRVDLKNIDGAVTVWNLSTWLNEVRRETKFKGEGKIYCTVNRQPMPLDHVHITEISGKGAVELCFDANHFAAPSAPDVSMPNHDDLWNVLEEGRVPLRAFITEDAVNALIEDIQILYTDRLGKPVEVDLSHWVKTQGFDAWAADHAAVLRNLKAYLQSAGVRVKE